MPSRGPVPALIVRGLSPAKFRHVSWPKDVKAKLPRPEASSGKAGARVRPSSVVIKKAPASKVTGKASKRVQPIASAKAARANGSSTARAVADKGHAVTKPAGLTAAGPKAAGTKPATPTVTPSKPGRPVPPKQASGKSATPASKGSTPAAAAPATAVLPKKPARKSIKEAAGVSTDAVARRTGKTWDDWFDVLDSAGAQTLDQRGIIAILAQKHGIGPWWQQMIAVGYESLRAKTDKPAAAEGFQISESCTLDAPVTRVFRLWNDPGERARWLCDERFVVRGATTDRAIRARWGKGNSHVAVSFSEKSGKTEVSVAHHQIESRSAAEQMKAYWIKKLGLLDEALAEGR
jgi:hypothetical protein